MYKDLPIKEWMLRNSVVNVSGTMTALGASMVPREIASAIHDSLEIFLDINSLQAEASRVISEITGAEAGCITACAASGICIGLAATVTGENLAAAESLPIINSSPCEVVILKGHIVSYGGQIEQLIQMVGAKAVEIGSATLAERYQLSESLSERTVAGLWVVSHHTVQSRLMSFDTFVKICHKHSVPVVVDAASEYDLKFFFEHGADLVIYSGHKFLSGPTSGIIAGKLPLIRAAYMHQTSGIGRVMKVGKESIVGVIAAIQRWKLMDHKKLHKEEYRRLKFIQSGIDQITGLISQEIPDPTGNPITRLKISIEPEVSSLNVEKLSNFLKNGQPPIFVRDHHVDLGYIEIDPCNMKENDLEIVLSRFKEFQNHILNHPPIVSEEEKLGPRYSRYNDQGIPSVESEQVPWNYHRPSDKEEILKAWPQAFQRHDNS